MRRRRGKGCGSREMTGGLEGWGVVSLERKRAEVSSFAQHCAGNLQRMSNEGVGGAGRVRGRYGEGTCVRKGWEGGRSPQLLTDGLLYARRHGVPGSDHILASAAARLVRGRRACLLGQERLVLLHLEGRVLVVGGAKPAGGEACWIGSDRGESIWVLAGRVRVGRVGMGRSECARATQ